jgi:hypothetical protein
MENQPMSTAAIPNSPSIVIKPLLQHPGYIALIANGDPETDPAGTGATRSAAALDLARKLIEQAHPCLCLAIAAVIREDAEALPAEWAEAHSGMIRAAGLVEGIA